MNKNRLSLQLIENGKEKSTILKRITILMKNIKGHFPSFSHKCDSLQQLEYKDGFLLKKDVGNSSLFNENPKESNQNNSTKMSIMKDLCILPGYQNITFESFRVPDLKIKKHVILKTASLLIS